MLSRLFESYNNPLRLLTQRKQSFFYKSIMYANTTPPPFCSYPAYTSAWQSAQAVAFAIRPEQQYGYWSNLFVRALLTVWFGLSRLYVRVAALVYPAIRAKHHTYYRPVFMRV